MSTQQQNKPEVLVFATNVRYKKDLLKLSPVLESEKRISHWSVDREDTGKILRVEARQMKPLEVVSLLQNAGFSCEELPD